MLRLLNNSDKTIVLGYLERNPLETTFLTGNILNFGLENDNSIRRCADYYGYFIEGVLKGILPFYNLGSCIPHYEEPSAILEFSKIMRTREFDFLVGMNGLVKPLFDSIGDVKSVIHYSDSSYFINENFVSFNLENIEFIDSKHIPLEKAEDFIMKAYEDGFRAVRERSQIKNMLSERSPEEEFLFLLVDGEIKAQANIQTYTDNINQIGAVYTLDTERGKGYCKAIVSELCRRIIARGKMPTLSVRKNNTPAVRAYTALGFKHYDDYLIINLKQVQDQS